MSKKNAVYFALALAVGVIFSGRLGFGEFLNIRAAYGYGGGGGGGVVIFSTGGGSAYSPSVSSVGAAGVQIPLTIGSNQSGTLEQAFANGAVVKITIPQGAVNGQTTFRVTDGSLNMNRVPSNPLGAFLIGQRVYNISASNLQGGSTRGFDRSISISIVVPGLPENAGNLGIYYFNEASNAWVLVPGSRFDAVNGRANFEVSHLTDFAIMQVPGLPSSLPVVAASQTSVTAPTSGGTPVTYYDGALLRSSAGRVYVLEGGKRYAIVNLDELRKYSGRSIFNVSEAVLAAYPIATRTVATDPGIVLADGDLVRGMDGKVYLLSDGKKVHVPTLAELARFSGRKITNVSDSVLAAYANDGVVSEGRLVRRMDAAVYIIRNGIKQRISDAQEMVRYAGQKIYGVVDGTKASGATSADVDARKYGNGDVIRTPDGKIYAIEGGKKRYVNSLEDMGAAKGKAIKEVSYSVANSFADYDVMSEGNLIRMIDKKVYIITNGVKVHIKNLAELARYAGQKIYNVVGDAFGR
jgi:hypothetical protein